MCREYDVLCIEEKDGKFFVREILLVPRWEDIVKGPFDTMKEAREAIHNETDL